MKKGRIKKKEVPGRTHDSDSTTLLTYIQEINKIPLLGEAEEKRLAKLAVQGNKAAREKLLSANLRFVIMVAKKFQGKGLELDDLISEGNIGMLNAISHFDVEKGYRFITYAVWWIRQAIIKAIHEKGRMIRLPSNKNRTLTKIEKTGQVINDDSGWKNDSKIREVARFLDISPEKAADLIQISRGVISLDDPVPWHDDSLTLKDNVEDTYSPTPVETAMNSVMKDDLNEVLDGLEKRAAEVIRCRYGLKDSTAMTLQEVGARYNLSRERVRQIEKRALTQLQIQQSPNGNLRWYIA